MKYKSLHDGFTLPVLGLGTRWIGGFREADFSRDQESIQAIKVAIALGYTYIDTAEIYGAGHTEELIGEAIKDLERSKLIITSNVAKTNLRYDEVISACKKSLQRLKTDYIDIYLIHGPNIGIPLEETMRAMNYLVEQKLVRYIGVGNFSAEQMKEAQRFSKNKIVINQTVYNLNTRNLDPMSQRTDMESEIIPYCQAHDIMVIAYRPIERGFLLQPNPLLDSLAEKYHATKAQIAISRLISKKNIITISKSTNAEHLKENLAAVDLELSDEDIQLLDTAHFAQPQNNF